MTMLAVAMNDEDKRTIEEYMRYLSSTNNPTAISVYGFLKAAVLNGVCSLEDNVNMGLKKIGKNVQRRG